MWLVSVSDNDADLFHACPPLLPYQSNGEGCAFKIGNSPLFPLRPKCSDDIQSLYPVNSTVSLWVSSVAEFEPVTAPPTLDSIRRSTRTELAVRRHGQY